MVYYWGQTYEVTEETERFAPLLSDAVEYQKQFPEYVCPHSWWTDRSDRLYIRWEISGRTGTGPVWRYHYDEDDMICGEEMPRNISKAERLRGDQPDSPVTLITGDTHRRFERLISFTQKYGVVEGDTMIILGDAGINYYGGFKDEVLKRNLSHLGMKLFCVHGNHEMRPESTGLYEEREWNGGKVYVEAEYPLLMFAKDGEIYDINGYRTIVIGGAYSVDKFYRLERGYNWFSDEQPTDETKAFVEQQLDKAGWSVDVVLSHTLPYQYRPVDLFIRGLDQSTVDSSTEKWLTDIESRLTYKRWYAGHYHCDRDIDDLKIMYRKVCLFMNDTDLMFEME